jgi:aminodeoxyfutalosine deaminase
MVQYRADWILPIAGRPLRDGWVRIDRGRVVAMGGQRQPAGDGSGPGRPSDEADLGSVAVLPGLVNAHTHLELSWMRGRLPEAGRFAVWIRGLVELRGERAEREDPAVREAVVDALAEVRRSGTAVVGDISNSLVSAGPLAASGLAAVVFRELAGLSGERAAALVSGAQRDLESVPATARVRHSLAAHAPYSVAPLLFRAIKAALDRDPFAPCSVHLGESTEEIEFLRTGTGPWRDLLGELRSGKASWVAPGCDPVEYLERVGFLDSRVLVAHGVHLSTQALERLARLGATLVTCPRSNIRTGAGTPPVAGFYASGARVAVGTDSLASAPDLNLFSELAQLRRLAPAVPASALIESATYQGARALGFQADFGTIEPGKRAELIAVEVPPGTQDVEEYLLTGMEPGQIRWLDADPL